MDVGIRAVLSGFEEAKKQFADLNKEMDKTVDSSNKVGAAGKTAGTGINDAAKAAAEGAADFGRLGSAALVAGAAIGTGLAAAAAYVGKQFMEGFGQVRQYGEELHNLSQRTGMSVESLGSLSLAAKTNELSMEGMAGGIQQFNRRITEATKGTGEASDAFKRLGVDIRDQQGGLKTNEQLLKEVAEKFANMEDSAGKTALAMDLFGRSGANMIPLLNEGSRGLDRLAEDAKKAGLVLSQETAEAAQKFNANMEVLKSYGQGFWMGVASPIVEGLAKITTAMREARRDGEGFFGSMYEGAKKLFEVMFLSTPQQKLGRLNTQIGESQNYIREVESQLASNKDARGRTLTPSARTALERRLSNAYAGLQDMYATQGGLEAEIEVNSPDFMRGPKTTAPEKDPKAGRAGRAGPSLMSQLTAGARTWHEMVDTGELSRQDYITNLQAVSEAFKEHEEVRVHFAAMAARELKKINEEASRNALALLKRQEALEHEAEKKGVEDAVKAAEMKLFTRKEAIERSMNLNERQKLEALEALKAEMQAEAYLADFSKEWRNKMLQLDKDIARQRVVVAEESQKQITAILGKAEFDGVAVFRGLAGGVKDVFKEILSGHINLTKQMQTIWARMVDAVLDELARMAARAVLEPIFEPMKRIFKDVGEWIMKNVFDPVWEFIKAGFMQLVKWLRDLDWGSSFSGLNNAINSLMGQGGSMNNLVQGLMQVMGMMKSGGGGMGGGGGDQWLSTLTGAGLDYLFPGAGTIFNAIGGWNTVGSVVGGVVDTVGSFVESIFDFFPTGTDMVVSKPTAFVAGDAGPERVTVSPLAGAARHGMGGGSTYVFHGPVMLDEYTMRRFKQMMAG